VLAVENMSKQYTTARGATVRAVSEISFTLDKFEILAVVGPSGCGKSTLLRLISGIEVPSKGTIRFRDGPPRIGFVFQSDAIFPWRTVGDNLAYPLEVGGCDADERKTAAERVCRLVGLAPETYLSKYPIELSGGEARRVSIGMALTREANLLLLDEPTSQLDSFSKIRIHGVLQDIWAKRPSTVICVTHDLEEAFVLADRILVMSGGRILGEVAVNLPKPRRLDIIDANAFADCRSAILGHFDVAS
jgi:ABC-type nitrate/sulfonate/bicarbonate transport system ATPase subunit